MRKGTNLDTCKIVRKLLLKRHYTGIWQRFVQDKIKRGPNYEIAA